MARKVAYGEGRSLLIAGTVDIVAERGLRGLTFRVLADHVGVNNSLIAQHFGSREGLLSATLDWVLETSVDLTQVLYFDSDTVFADEFLAAMMARPEIQIFQYEMILEATRNPVFKEQVDSRFSGYHNIVIRNLQAHGVTGNLDTVARSISAGMDGIALQYMVGTDPVLLRDSLAHLWRTYIQPLL